MTVFRDIKFLAAGPASERSRSAAEANGIGTVEPHQFRIQTRDGRARLAGQIDLPRSHGAARYPVVLMVPGGWFMDRDGYMGGSGTERDLIYRDLAQGLLAARDPGVRYGNRS